MVPSKRRHGNLTGLAVEKVPQDFFAAGEIRISRRFMPLETAGAASSGVPLPAARRESWPMVASMLVEWLLVAPIAEAVILVFAFAFGAGVGSFLNVVVYRLPRGESLVFGGSHCPTCRSAIRSCDNVPVVGWLRLGGHCRDCRGPISCRYPLVEAIAGLVVTAIVAIDLLARTPGGRPGVDGLLFGESWTMVAVCLFHCWLALTWLAWALLAWDGHSLPLLWVGPTVLAALVVPACLPEVGWIPGLVSAGLPLVLLGIVRSVRRP